MFDWKQNYTFVPYFQHIVKRICYPDWHMQRMFCEYHNFTFVEKGQGIIEINGVTHPLKRGVFVYMAGDMLRSVTSSQEDPLEFFGVNFMYAIAAYQERKWIQSEPPLPFNTYQEIHNSIMFYRLVSLFNELSTAWIGAQPDKNFRCQIAFMEIFKLLMEWQDNKNTLPIPQTKKVQQIINFMAANMQEKISLEALSRKFDISAPHMDHLFRQATGKSPMQYLALIRINKAKQLLLEDFSVTQAARATGFSDIYYFSRYFKKMTGFAPSNYKEHTSFHVKNTFSGFE